MRSLTYHTGVSVVAGRVGARVFDVVVADLVVGAAVVARAMWGTSYVSSLRGGYIIGGHAVEELGRHGALVGGAPARWFVYISA